MWRPAHGLTAQQYQAGFNAQAVQGFYPICVQLAHNSHERPSKGSYFLCDAAADITWHVLASAAREMGMRDTAYTMQSRQSLRKKKPHLSLTQYFIYSLAQVTSATIPARAVL